MEQHLLCTISVAMFTDWLRIFWQIAELSPTFHLAAVSNGHSSEQKLSTSLMTDVNEISVYF